MSIESSGFSLPLPGRAGANAFISARSRVSHLARPTVYLSRVDYLSYNTTHMVRLFYAF